MTKYRILLALQEFVTSHDLIHDFVVYTTCKGSYLKRSTGSNIIDCHKLFILILAGFDLKRAKVLYQHSFPKGNEKSYK